MNNLLIFSIKNYRSNQFPFIIIILLFNLVHSFVYLFTHNSKIPMLQFLLITFHSLIPLTVNWKLIQRKRTEYFSIPQLNLINILIQIIVNPIPAFNTISLLFSLRARNSNEIVSFTRRVLACLRPFQFLWINLRDSSSVEKKKSQRTRRCRILFQRDDSVDFLERSWQLWLTRLPKGKFSPAFAKVSEPK